MTKLFFFYFLKFKIKKKKKKQVWGTTRGQEFHKLSNTKIAVGWNVSRTVLKDQSISLVDYTISAAYH